jgi:hypothetical protein
MFSAAFGLALSLNLPPSLRFRPRRTAAILAPSLAIPNLSHLFTSSAEVVRSSPHPSTGLFDFGTSLKPRSSRSGRSLSPSPTLRCWERRRRMKPLVDAWCWQLTQTEPPPSSRSMPRTASTLSFSSPPARHPQSRPLLSLHHQKEMSSP